MFHLYCYRDFAGSEDYYHSFLWKTYKRWENINRKSCWYLILINVCIGYKLRKLTENLDGLCEISGSHGGEYEVQSLLGCTAVFSNRCRPTFQRCVLSPSSGRWVSRWGDRQEGDITSLLFSSGNESTLKMFSYFHTLEDLSVCGRIILIYRPMIEKF
jgi:hypothetical protein